MKLKRIIVADFTFFIIMLLLVILSILSYQRINNLNREADLVNHTALVQLQLQQIQSHISDAEARQRYFLLTADSSYLLPYPEAIQKNRSYLSQLDSLMAGTPGQAENLVTLDRLSTKRLERLYEVMDQYTKEQRDKKALLQEGKHIMNDIRALIQKMTEIENRALAENNNQKNYSAYITPLYSLLLSVFSIFIISVAYFILRSETRLRFHAEDNIKRLHHYFKDLPAVFAIVKGPRHVHELTNDLYKKLAGKRDLKGKTFQEAFPELAGQGYFERLDHVYNTATPFIGKEMPVSLHTDGKEARSYYNFIFQPLSNDQKKTEGILIFGYETTEMVAARKKAEESDLRSRLAIDAASIGTFDWDMENGRFNSSPRLLEIFGFTNKETDIPHQRLLERFHPADKPVRDQAVKDSYQTGALSYEARIIREDGSVHWINVYGKINFNGLQQTSRMYGTVIDITDQKNFLEGLRESEAKFRLLADSLPQFVWTGDVVGKLDYFNQAVLTFTGLKSTEMQKKGWAIVHPADRDETNRQWMNAVTTGEPFMYEHRFRNDLGDYRWHMSQATPQKDHHGEIQRWVGTSTDIQDQRDRSQKLEEQISERTQQLRELNNNLLIKNNIFAQAEENALIGSYSWNLHNGEMEYSDNLFRLFGYEPNEFVPSLEKYFSMVHPEDKDQVVKDGMETLSTKNLAAHTYRIITKNESVKYFRSTGKIIGEGENTLLIGTVQDITQDTLLHETLRLKNLQLERINAELESFNYVASHDLQEPLRKIQAFSERILEKEGANFSAFSRNYFSRITASAARMQSLINALLTYSKADNTVKEAEPVNLNVLIENVKADLQEMIEEKKARIEFSGLPTINAIGLQVYQLFINLLSNAIKYSKANIAPHINIRASLVSGSEIGNEAADKKSQYWKITVEDNGIGFEQQYEHKIFELFQRLHNDNTYIGTGIGLAICKKIIRNHQGFISASGSPGIGSAFNIYFPA